MAFKSETREVKDFDEVALQGHGEIVLAQGDAESVTIEADEAILPLVKAEVEGRRLVLGYRHWWDHLLHPLSTLRFRVNAKTVRGIAISGSGNVKATAIQTADLRLDVSGSGEMAVDRLTARSVAVGISGAGKVIAAGETGRHSVHISGSGNVQTGELAAQEVAEAGRAHQRLRQREVSRPAAGGAAHLRFGKRWEGRELIACFGS